MKHLCSNCWHYIPPANGNPWECHLEYADDDMGDDPDFCHCTAWKSAQSEARFWKRCVKVVRQVSDNLIAWRKERKHLAQNAYYEIGWREALEEMARKFQRMGHVEIEEK